MAAELIVVAGPLSGERIPLSFDDIIIGRAPDCTICIPASDVAWRQCAIRAAGGHYSLRDSHSGCGTFVNGMAVDEHTLTSGDQVSIGETTILFRSSEDLQPVNDSTSSTLVRTCAVLHLARAMISVSEGRERALFETQLIALLSDLLEVDSGAVLVAEDSEGLIRAAQSRASADGLSPELGGALLRLSGRVVSEGACFDAPTGCIAVPMFSSGHLQGAIILRCTPAGVAELDQQRDGLAAIATLAASTLQSQREIQGLRLRTELLEESLGNQGGIVGVSPVIKKLLTMVDRVAPLDVTVLVLGESGSGKELVARAIHRGSPRHKKPFVAINCAAITDTLLESELFGHEKGSFTGAIVQKKGKLELAQGGTVFLDEIGELAPHLQAKLLRVLQEREFERVGGTQTIPLDVRLIAATNRDLATQVQRGAFREDLYHRLNVVVLRSPALRDRPDDIPLLAEHFVRSAAARCHRRVSGISSRASRALMAYSWPGNVRELANAMERAVVLGESDQIQVEDLPETIFEVPKPPGGVAPILASVGDAKRESIVRAWTEARGDYKLAAQRLGVHPNSLLRLIRNLGLREALPRFSEGT